MSEKKKTIAVIFGGASPEYEVSLSSAYSVISNMSTDKYCVVKIGITRNGEWYIFKGADLDIKNDTWCMQKKCKPIFPSPNPLRAGFYIMENGDDKQNLDQSNWEFLEVDAVFPLVHGKNGEDGRLQGIFELANIPIIGCDTFASALCMDKYRAKQIVAAAGVSVPKSRVIKKHELNALEHALKAEVAAEAITVTKASVLKELDLGIDYPLFVKPLCAGSSFGISRVSEHEDLIPAIKEAFIYDDEVIIEAAIEGFEVGCAIVGQDDDLLIGEIDEIQLSDHFFDFHEKYHLTNSAIHVPARIDKEKAASIKDIAKTIYTALGCSGFARVDCFLTPTGEIIFNEVNTIPGFTDHSRFPNMLKGKGYSFSEIIDLIIDKSHSPESNQTFSSPRVASKTFLSTQSISGSRAASDTLLSTRSFPSSGVDSEALISTQIFSSSKTASEIL